MSEVTSYDVGEFYICVLLTWPVLKNKTSVKKKPRGQACARHVALLGVPQRGPQAQAQRRATEWLPQRQAAGPRAGVPLCPAERPLLLHFDDLTASDPE